MFNIMFNKKCKQVFNLTLKAIGNILVANIKSIKAYVLNT